jgi:NAD(P)-dependent dehydrogenase (short-subunit alcohol dehydrogenase family)
VFDLTGHVALVTGGNTGLGLGMARGLARAGASVAIWGRNPERNAAACAELEQLGVPAAGFVCDVTDPAAITAAMAQTLERFGRLDSCFANAGGSGARGSSLEMSADAWRETMDLNFTSVVCTFQAAAKAMLKQGRGRLVATSSIAALLGVPGGGYSASKAAVSGLVRSLAVELAPAGITVNAVLPGYIETTMSLNTPQAFRDACLRRTPSGKIGTIDDMMGIAVFLAAAESQLLTGQSIVLDGGQSIFPM